jgi:hypothetical protein
MPAGFEEVQGFVGSGDAKEGVEQPAREYLPWFERIFGEFRFRLGLEVERGSGRAFDEAWFQLLAAAKVDFAGHRRQGDCRARIGESGIAGVGCGQCNHGVILLLSLSADYFVCAANQLSMRPA